MDLRKEKSNILYVLIVFLIILKRKKVQEGNCDPANVFQFIILI